MLNYNLNTELGLFNSSKGKVVDIVYAEDKKVCFDQPEFVLVKFDKYKGPPVFGDANPRVFPVFPQKNHNDSNAELWRSQFPLSVRYASTVDKVQGKTLD